MPPRATQHLVFRTAVDSDVNLLLTIFENDGAMRFLPAARVTDVDRMRLMVTQWNRWEQRLGYSLWAVCSRQTGELLGDAGLMPYDGSGPEVEVAGHLLIRRWSRALVMEAASAILGFAFEELHLPRVIAAAAPDHRATRRVLTVLGFAFRESVPLRAPLTGHMDVFELSGAQWLESELK